MVRNGHIMALTACCDNTTLWTHGVISNIIPTVSLTTGRSASYPATFAVSWSYVYEHLQASEECVNICCCLVGEDMVMIFPGSTLINVSGAAVSNETKPMISRQALCSDQGGP